MSEARAVRLALLAAVLTGACAQPSQPPRWVELARDFEPLALMPLAQEWQRAAGQEPGRCAQHFLGVEVSHPLPPQSWRQGPEPGVWRAAAPRGALLHGHRGFARLQAGTSTWLEAPDDKFPEGTLRLQGDTVAARFGEDGPPEGLELLQRLENGRRASDGVWQLRIRDDYATGIPVWSGQAEELVVDLPRDSALALEVRYQTRAPAGPVVIRVSVDDDLVYELESDSTLLGERGSFVRIPMPARARSAAKLRFEASGPPGQALLMRPVLGPNEIGSPRERPWPDARPDVVLVLADTLRADALALGGGNPRHAPRLNRFAESALRFADARSNAAWTLPSIGTLLTGLAPGQHTANESNLSLPGELTTVVESLARSGYRTCAVTDAAFFTPLHGLDQGFESFVVRHPAHWDLDETVARALELADRDDGRPLFLLVHTYRTHLPFRVGPDEDRGPWDALRAQGCTPLKSMPGPRDAWLEELARCAGDFRALYAEGVRDLDRGIGVLLDALEKRGLPANGYVLFTSDHGEALGENDEMFHGGPLWESKLRIPLLLAGPGVEARDEPAAVTLLDVAPTLAEIAGLERQALWAGHSLLDVPAGRPALAFRLQTTRQVSVVDGRRKILTPRPETLVDGEQDAAFDLALDPWEENELKEAPWAGELARSHAALVEALLAPATGTVDVPLGPSLQNELEQLGYGGGGE